MTREFNELDYVAYDYYNHKENYTDAEARFLSLYAARRGGQGFSFEDAVKVTRIETAQQYGKAEVERIMRRFGVIK